MHGWGGAGKSAGRARVRLAQPRCGISVVWWLNAQTEEGVIDGLLRLGAMFQQRRRGKSPDRRAAATARNQLAVERLRPMVARFDNFEDEAGARHGCRDTGARGAGDVARWAMLGVGATEHFACKPGRTRHRDRVFAARERTFRPDRRRRTCHRHRRRFAAAGASARRRFAAPHADGKSGALPRAHYRAPQKGAPQRGISAIRLRNLFYGDRASRARSRGRGRRALLCGVLCTRCHSRRVFRQPAGNYPPSLRPKLSEVDALDLHSVVVDELRLDEALGALDRLSLLAFSQGARIYDVHRLVQLACARSCRVPFRRHANV